ncbi:MAG: hypothetical protein AAF747_01755, partial [Planctomycetota bacterium]
MSTKPAMPRLRDLSASWRLGLTFCVLTLLGGYLVSGIVLVNSYENRDQRPGLTMTDIVGAYHGVRSPAPLITSLEAGHPNDLDPELPLPEDLRDALLAWLDDAENLSLSYDDLDLGDEAPAEIIATYCLDCHVRGAEGEYAAPDVSLEYWSDVEPLAVSRDIQPKDLKVVSASVHAHAPSMGIILVVLGLLAAMTRAHRAIVGGLFAISAISLFADFAGQYLTRLDPIWAWAIVAGGGIA